MRIIISQWVDRPDIEIGQTAYLEDGTALGAITAFDPETGAVEVAYEGSEMDLAGKRVRLENKTPLRQLLDVLSTGYQSLKEDIDSFATQIDIDGCPEEFLPHLAALLGFEFPYDLDVVQQRSYLRNIITLYRTKGTAWALRIAALRIIGAGFDLVVTNEDHVAKTFDVEVTADGDTTTGQMEQKLTYMVNQYSPAGMIPTVTVIYYFSEATALASRSTEEFEDTAFSAWRTNMVGHLTNDEARLNAYGEVPLDL